MNRRGRGTIRVLGLILGALAMVLPIWNTRASKSGSRNIYLETGLNSPTGRALNAAPRRSVTFSPASVAQLISDINTSNTDNADDIIDLGGFTFTLTAVDNNTSGPNGLPSILSDNSHTLLIENGVINRSSAGTPPSFRLFYVSPGGSLTLSNVTIANGNPGSGNNGGGIFNRGMLTLNNCTVSGNSASSGGGIDNLADASAPSPTLTLNNCTVSGNSAVNGGGLFNVGSGAGNAATLIVNNSTIAGNSASAGSGIFYDAISGGTATMTLYNSTLADNSASISGGGIFSSGGTATIGSSIIARNTASTGPDVNGTFTSNGFNLIGDETNSIGFTQPTDQTGTTGSPLDPLLGPLQNNGGPTPTMALLAGSPAIDKGDDAVLGPPLSLATDQRGAGFSRKVGTHVDVGAFEAQCVICPPNVTQNNDPGQCGAQVSYPAPVSEACGPVGCLPQPGSFFPVGTTTVTCSPRQDSPISCTFTVTVNDTQGPAIACNNVAAQTAPAGANCSATVPDVRALVRAQSIDNCTATASLTITQNPMEGSTVSGTGSHPITVTVKDAGNNSTDCIVAFTVTDTQKPTITCPASVMRITARPGDATGVVNYATPSASGNCSTASVVCVPPSGATFPLGTTSVTCTVTDMSMNTATCSFIVRVFDVSLQDDSNPNTSLVWNSVTGDYRFCCSGTVYSGRGTSTRRGSTFTLTLVASQRINASVDATQNKGSATLQAGSASCTISDRDIRNNTNLCALSGGGS